jgi:YD repeat-containing protein
LYKSDQQTGGVNYQMTVSYNNGGARTSATYPSGHVVNYNYDQAGRLGDKDAQHLAMTGNLGDGVTRSYATGMTYSELGGLQQEQFGTVTPLCFNAKRPWSRFYRAALVTLIWSVCKLPK